VRRRRKEKGKGKGPWRCGSGEKSPCLSVPVAETSGNVKANGECGLEGGKDDAEENQKGQDVFLTTPFWCEAYDTMTGKVVRGENGRLKGRRKRDFVSKKKRPSLLSSGDMLFQPHFKHQKNKETQQLERRNGTGEELLRPGRTRSPSHVLVTDSSTSLTYGKEIQEGPKEKRG